MDEMQTQQPTSSTDNSTSVGTQTLTTEDVQTAVESALRNVGNTNDEQLRILSEGVASIDSRLQTVAENTANDGEQQSPEETIYTIRLEPGQTTTAKTGARVVCTEGIVIIILLAVSCGLQLFRILSERWH